MQKASLLLSIDQELRFILYGIATSLDAVINSNEVERLFAHSEAGDRTAQDFVFYDGPLSKVFGHVDEYEPETVFLHVESKRLDQKTLERYVVTAKDRAFHSS